MRDLGKWAQEEYRIAGKEQASGEDEEQKDRDRAE